MMIYNNYEKFIHSYDDLVELHIIQLIDTTLKLLKNEIIYSDVEKKFYIYKNKFWQPIDIDEVISIYWQVYSKQIFPQLKDHKSKIEIEYYEEKVKNDCDEKKIKNLKRILERYNFFIKMTQKKIKIYIESLGMCIERIPDFEYDKIPLKNGYIDIENNFKFKDLDPYIYNRYCLNFNFTNTKTEPTIFLKFLKQIMPNDDDRDFLINWLAYFLISGNHRQKALFFYGSGRNGKGVLSRIIAQLLGDNNCTSLTVKQLNGEKYFLPQLNNKLLNISPDSSDKDVIDIGVFKTFTGGDKVTVRDIYGKPFDMVYNGKLLFSINRVPYFSEKDFAIMERIEILNFPITIKEEDRIPNLEAIILEKEAEEIFSFLLERLKILREIDFKFKAPQSVKEFTNSLIDEQDNLSDFLYDYINNNEEDNFWQIGLRAFYRKYKEYILEAGFKTLNEKNFKENVLKWAERRKNEIDIRYEHNGKNYVFRFGRKVAEKIDFEERNLLNLENCPF